MSFLLWKWHDLTWPRIGPNFNLHHLWEISMVFKMTMLTPKSGIQQINIKYFHVNL